MHIGHDAKYSSKMVVTVIESSLIWNILLWTFYAYLFDDVVGHWNHSHSYSILEQGPWWRLSMIPLESFGLGSLGDCTFFSYWLKPWLCMGTVSEVCRADLVGNHQDSPRVNFECQHLISAQAASNHFSLFVCVCFWGGRGFVFRIATFCFWGLKDYTATDNDRNEVFPSMTLHRSYITPS